MSVRQIAQVETMLGEAIASKRFDVLRSLSHPSFSYIGVHNDQQVHWNRGDWLREVSALRTLSFVHVTNDVMLFEGLAIVTVEALWIGHSPGRAFQQKLRMSDNWVSCGRSWKLIRRHVFSADHRPEERTAEKEILVC